MGIETKHVTVKGVDYEFNTWPAEKGIGYGVRLLALGGDGLGAFIQGQANMRFREKKDENGTVVLDSITGDPVMEVVPDENNNFLQKTTSLIVSKLNKDEVVNLIKEMLSGVRHAGQSQPINFNMEFASNYGAMAQLLIEVIKENRLHDFLLESATGVL